MYDVSVQVMNATYVPLGRTKVSRAISLVIRGEAVIEESIPGKFIRSMQEEYPYPLIVRLLRYVKVPVVYREQNWTKKGVLERDKYKCVYCLGSANTIDHLLPLSRGGENTWLNTAAACKEDNWRKDDKTPVEAGMDLLYTPTVPMKMYFNTKKKGR